MSHSFRMPWLEMSMFSGLMSRWMTWGAGLGFGLHGCVRQTRMSLCVLEWLLSHQHQARNHCAGAVTLLTEGWGCAKAVWRC